MKYNILFAGSYNNFKNIPKAKSSLIAYFGNRNIEDQCTDCPALIVNEFSDRDADFLNSIMSENELQAFIIKGDIPDTNIIEVNVEEHTVEQTLSQ